MMDRLGVALLAVVLAASPASAQTDSLQEIEDLLASGRFTSARSALDRWLDQHKPGGTNASAEERAHALLLSGRLTTDVEESEEKYRAVVLSYPSSPFAPKAVLLLGQGLAARGENERAEAQLRRVATDYPASTERATAMLWIARLQGAANDWPAACETVRQAMTTRSAGREVVALLRSEEETACNRPAQRQAPAPPPSNARVIGRGASASPQPTSAAQAGTFSVQVAAVRSERNAQTLTARIRRLGFDARTTFVQGSELARVRVGRFKSANDAAATARRLRDAGFEAITVDDVRRER